MKNHYKPSQLHLFQHSWPPPPLLPFVFSHFVACVMLLKTLLPALPCNSCGDCLHSACVQASAEVAAKLGRSEDGLWRMQEASLALLLWGRVEEGRGEKQGQGRRGRRAEGKHNQSGNDRGATGMRLESAATTIWKKGPSRVVGGDHVATHAAGPAARRLARRQHPVTTWPSPPYTRSQLVVK